MLREKVRLSLADDNGHHDGAVREMLNLVEKNRSCGSMKWATAFSWPSVDAKGYNMIQGPNNRRKIADSIPIAILK